MRLLDEYQIEASQKSAISNFQQLLIFCGNLIRVLGLVCVTMRTEASRANLKDPSTLGSNSSRLGEPG